MRSRNDPRAQGLRIHKNHYAWPRPPASCRGGAGTSDGFGFDPDEKDGDIYLSRREMRAVMPATGAGAPGEKRHGVARVTWWRC